jgi:hypothetical protein
LNPSAPSNRSPVLSSSVGEVTLEAYSIRE